MSETSRIERALSQIDDWIGPQGVNGACAAVWRRGAPAAVHAAGEAQPGTPTEPDTIFALASVTKPVAATAVMTLVESGAIGLDESAARFVPEFGAGPDAGAENVTPEFERLRRHVSIRQLLCHTSGLPEDMAPGRLRYIDKHDLSTMSDVMCRLPLRSAPGAEMLYSNAGVAVLSRVVERVSGREFWEYARENVLGPLELHDTHARPSADLDLRIARVTDTNHTGTDIEPYNSNYWRSLAMPWGGLYGSAPDLAHFAGAFLAGGPKLLSRASIGLMTSDQVQGVPGGVESMKVTWNPAEWGLGWEVKGRKRRHWTGELTSPRTFCHFGAAGTLLWADPEHDVALAVFANRTTIHLWPFLPARWSRLSNSVIAALE